MTTHRRGYEQSDNSWCPESFRHYWVLSRMKSTADGIGCPAEVPSVVAGTFAATLKRRYAAPPPFSVISTGVPSKGRVRSGNLPPFSAGKMLRKFQLGFV